MKKHKIKRLVTDMESGDKHTVEVEAEIYEYKGLQFGIYWPIRRTSIRAIELQTGCSVGEFSYVKTKTPRKDLLQLIAHFVDKANCEQAISWVRDDLAQRRWEFNVQIHELEKKRDCLVFPINERIEI